MTYRLPGKHVKSVRELELLWVSKEASLQVQGATFPFFSEIP